MEAMETPLKINGTTQENAHPQGVRAPSLKQKTVSGLKWLIANNFLKKALSICSMAILARILDPSTFGLFAMAFLAIDGFSLFKSFGIDTALIQRKENVEAAKHTAFFLIQAVDIILFLIFQLSAPLAAKALNNPDVLTIMRALSFVFILNGFGRIPGAMLTRQMRFRDIAVVEFVTSVVNSVFSVLLAMLTPTVWALVGAYLLKQLTTVMMNWKLERYSVKWVFDRKIAKELIHFGKYMVGLSLLWYFANNFDNMVIARLMGSTALGYFILANNITYFTHSQFLTHMGTVMFPAFARLQDDPEALKRAYLKNVRFVSMLITPYGVALLLLAREVVMAFYGQKWLVIVPVIQWLSYIHLFTPIYACAGSVFMGSGKPNYVYRLQLLSLFIKLPVSYFLVKSYGLMGAVYAGIIETVFVGPANYYLARKIIGFRLRDILRQIVPTLVCCAFMAAVIIALKVLFANDHTLSTFTIKHRQIIPLFIFGSLAGLTYLISFYFVDRSSFNEVRQMLFSRFDKKA